MMYRVLKRVTYSDVDWIYLSSKRMTVAVRSKAGVVCEAPPIVRRFIGQPLGDLMGWMSKQPGFRWEEM